MLVAWHPFEALARGFTLIVFFVAYFVVVSSTERACEIAWIHAANHGHRESNRIGLTVQESKILRHPPADGRGVQMHGPLPRSTRRYLANGRASMVLYITNGGRRRLACENASHPHRRVTPATPHPRKRQA